MSRPKDDLSWTNLALRLGLNTLSHPIEYAKILMQIGHEPISPYPTKTLFGKPALALPNVFKYVSYIYTVDGLSGCYRGLAPRLSGNLVLAVVYSKATTYLKIDSSADEDDEEGEENLQEEERRMRFLVRLSLDLTARTAGLVVSQPLNVITVRMMAQFVGGEDKYSGIFSSVGEIYRENGILGFFSGLVPRLIGELTSILIASTVSYAITHYIVEDKDLHSYISSSVSLLASTLMYPFQLISTCMAVSGSGLVAGKPPHMPLYTSWIDCWSHLSRTNQIKRGSSLFWRYYSGPQSIGSSMSLRSNEDEYFRTKLK